MQRTVAFGQCRIQGAHAVQLLPERALFAVEMAGDVEVVYLELFPFRDEQVRFRVASLGVQDALLLVVVIHDGFTDELLARLWWWTKTIRLKRTETYLVHWSKHMVTDGTFSMTNAANPTKIICGTRVKDGTLRHVRGAKNA